MNPISVEWTSDVVLLSFFMPYIPPGVRAMFALPDDADTLKIGLSNDEAEELYKQLKRRFG